MNAHGPLLALATGAVLGLLASPASAATWLNPRTTPSLHEILTVDATGEALWPYGAEDIAGDGLATFLEPEQSVDIRSVYVATDATHFLVRTYVSSTVAVSTGDTVYVFIDTDDDATTGGSAAAVDLNAKFTTDPTAGGYELVIGIRGSATVSQIWQWNKPTNAFVGAVPDSTLARAETGTDVDPLRILATVHGYLQANVDLTLLPGLTPACAARIFVRSVDDSGIADLNVGTIEPCVAVDDTNGFPDVVPTPVTCTTDDQCPGGGICVDNACVLPEPCVVDTDCKATEQCLNDNCVPKPGGACTKNADCAGLVCVASTCTACVQGTGDLCGPGMRCGPRGTCVTGPTTVTPDAGMAETGIPIHPGDVVQGGACACSVGSTRQRDDALGVLFGVALAAALRGRRSRRNAGKGS